MKQQKSPKFYQKVKDASRSGDPSLPKLLKELSRHTESLRRYIRKAFDYNDLDMLKILFDLPATSLDQKEYIFLHASKLGHLDIVRAGVQSGIDPKLKECLALRWASMEGRLDVVKYLIPLSEPKVYESNPLQLAFHGNHFETFVALLPVSEPDHLRKKIQKEYLKDVNDFIQKAEAVISARYLECHLKNIGKKTLVTPRKI